MRILYKIPFIRQITNYFYSVSCFKMIVNNDVIKSRYSFKVEDIVYTFPKLTKYGVLYLFIPVPKEIAKDQKLINEFLTTKMTFLNKVLIEALLLDGSLDMKLIKLKDTGTEDMLMLVKFTPVFTLSDFLKFLGILSVLGYALYKINKHYAIDNILESMFQYIF